MSQEEKVWCKLQAPCSTKLYADFQEGSKSQSIPQNVAVHQLSRLHTTLMAIVHAFCEYNSSRLILHIHYDLFVRSFPDLAGSLYSTIQDANCSGHLT